MLVIVGVVVVVRRKVKSARRRQAVNIEDVLDNRPQQPPATSAWGWLWGESDESQPATQDELDEYDLVSRAVLSAAAGGDEAALNMETKVLGVGHGSWVNASENKSLNDGLEFDDEYDLVSKAVLAAAGTDAAAPLSLEPDVMETTA